MLQDISTPPPPQTILFCSSDKIKNEIHLDKDDDDQVVDDEDKNIPKTTAVDLPSFFEDLIEDNKCILCS